MNGLGNFFEQLFHHFHHPDVVFVGHIDLHGGKLWVVGSVHALVAEHLAKLIYPIKTTHDQSLQVEFVGDPQE